jgi:hypothetical protein
MPHHVVEQAVAIDVPLVRALCARRYTGGNGFMKRPSWVIPPGITCLERSYIRSEPVKRSAKSWLIEVETGAWAIKSCPSGNSTRQVRLIALYGKTAISYRFLLVLTDLPSCRLAVLPSSNISPSPIARDPVAP